MGYYKFKHSELEQLANDIKASAKKEIAALDKLGKDVGSFSQSENISGNTADAMKAYYPGLYVPVITSMKLLIDHQAQECIRYVKAYDSANLGGSTQIDMDELTTLVYDVTTSRVKKIREQGMTVRQLMSSLHAAGVEGLPHNFNHEKNIDARHKVRDNIQTILSNINSIEGQYSKNYQSNSYVVQLKRSINALLRQRTVAGAPALYKCDMNELMNSPESIGMRNAALALWYNAYLHQNDSEDLGMDYGDFAGIEEVNTFEAWATEEDIAKFRELQFVPYDEWPEEYKKYYSWAGTDGFNGYPRNGQGGNCTWYAFGRFMHIQQKAYAIGPGDDAYSWIALAPSRGYQTGWEPVEGSIVCWDYGTGANGHVAVVEKLIAPCAAYPYGAAVISQSSWSGSGPNMFINVDVCPMNKDGSLTRVYNGWQDSRAAYRGCVLPDEVVGKDIETPFGKTTDGDKKFLRELTQGKKPTAYGDSSGYTETRTHKPDNHAPLTSSQEAHKPAQSNHKLGNTQHDSSHNSDQGPRTVGGNFRTSTPPQPSSEVFEDQSGLDSANDRKNVVKDALDYGQSQTHTNAAFNLDRMGVPPQTSQPVTRLSELDMESLQRKLGVPVDGDLGPETISAIQKEVGATVDGYWGTETSAKMQEYLGVEVDGYASTETLTALNEWATK